MMRANRLMVFAMASFAIGTLVPIGAALAQASGECPQPDWAAIPAEPLPALARKLTSAGASVTIVVLGPLPSGARGRKVDALNYPARLQARLGETWAGRSVKVESIGKPRGNVFEQRSLIDKRVLPLKPDLVIWQIGRADARGAVPSNRFGQELLNGIASLKGASSPIDTILMTMQFHPNSEALYRTDEYRNTIAWVGRTADTTVVDRFTLIEHWWDTGKVDFDSQDPAVQKKDAEWIQHCIADQLAATIVEGVGTANTAADSSAADPGQSGGTRPDQRDPARNRVR